MNIVKFCQLLLEVGPESTSQSSIALPATSIEILAHSPIVKFCDNFYLVALDTELSVIVIEEKKKTAQH
jgi:hypothetical protein